MANSSTHQVPSRYFPNLLIAAHPRDAPGPAKTGLPCKHGHPRSDPVPAVNCPVSRPTCSCSCSVYHRRSGGKPHWPSWAPRPTPCCPIQSQLSSLVSNSGNEQQARNTALGRSLPTSGGPGATPCVVYPTDRHFLRSTPGDSSSWVRGLGDMQLARVILYLAR